jgi:hypothetical protein
MEPPRSEARREREIADQLLATRSAQALAAARIEPPAYVVKELGRGPIDPAKAKTWDRGVQGVEGYRLENGVKDTRSPFGAGPKDAVCEHQGEDLRIAITRRHDLALRDRHQRPGSDTSASRRVT